MPQSSFRNPGFWDKLYVAALGMDRVMVQPHLTAHLVQQLRFLILTVHGGRVILDSDFLT